MKLDVFLIKTYFDPENNTSFFSVNKLYKIAKTKFPKVTLDNIQDWLSTQDIFTLHKPAKKNFKRNKIVVQGIDHQWQVDLADISTLAKSNNGYHYILTCIDILSRYAYIIQRACHHGSLILNLFNIPSICNFHHFNLNHITIHNTSQQ